MPTMPSRLEPSRVPHLLVFRNAGPEPIQHLNPAEREELTQKWNRWYEELARTGKVQQGQPLAAHGRVVSGTRGERVVDGPYAEAKEAIGGFFLLTPMDLDEATAIARMCPSLPYGLTVEVRPVAAVSPTLEGVRGRPV